MDPGLNKNYCRNPDNREYIWCYTKDRKSKEGWEFCEPLAMDYEVQVGNCRHFNSEDGILILNSVDPGRGKKLDGDI